MREHHKELAYSSEYSARHGPSILPDPEELSTIGLSKGDDLGALPRLLDLKYVYNLWVTLTSSIGFH